MSHQPRRYTDDLVIYVEDGAASVGRSMEAKGQWFAEFIVNDEGGYVSVTISEAQLRTLVDYIDRNRAVEQ